MTKLYENIRKLRIEKGISQEQLAEMTGYRSRTSISKIEAGEVDLSQSKIKIIAEALGTTPAKLLGWVGEDDSPLFYPESLKLTIPFISQKLSAGPGENWLSDEDMEVKTIDILAKIPAGVDPRSVMCAEVRGDSMVNVGLENGDLVVFARGLIESEGIYVIALAGDVMVKRIEWDRLEKEIHIISENPKYSTKVVAEDNENFAIIGKVLKWIHTVR